MSLKCKILCNSAVNSCTAPYFITFLEELAMTLQYRNLLSSMESEEELDTLLDDENEEETPAGTGDGETKDDDPDVEVTVEGDGDVTVETGEEEESEETSEETSEKEDTSEEETKEESSEETDEPGEEETPEDDTETPEEDVAGGDEKEDTSEEEETTSEGESEEAGEETETSGDEESEETSEEETGEADEEPGEEETKTDDTEEGDEPAIEPPTDDGDDGEFIEEVGEIEEDVSDTEGEIEETEDNIDKLEDVADELDEAQDALEAMVEAGDVPEYVEKMFMDKLSHISRRTGAQFRMVGSENHQGSKFQDPVFVDSLESSLKEVANQAWEAIKRMIDAALEQAKKLWSHLTDQSKRINDRAKSIKSTLEGKDFSTEGASDVAERLQKAKGTYSKVFANIAVKSGGKLQIDEGYLADINKLFEAYQGVVREDAKAAKDTVEILSSSETIRNMAGESPAEMTRKFFDKFNENYKDQEVDLPGGKSVYRKEGNVGVQDAVRIAGDSEANNKALVDGFTQFAGHKGNLIKLCDFIISATEQTAAVSKDYEKFQREYYKDLQDKIDKVLSSEIDKKDITHKTIISALSSGLVRPALRQGFAMTKESRKQWLKSLASMTVVLGAYAKAGQKMQEA